MPSEPQPLPAVHRPHRTSGLALVGLLALTGCASNGGADGSSGNAADGAPTVSLSATPQSVNSGTDVTISWSSTASTECSASGGWTGALTTSGSRVVRPSTSTSYSLACTGNGGTASQSVSVTVQGTRTPPPAVSISAAPTDIPTGSSTTLTWSSTDATSCTASGGWSGSKGTSGSQSASPTQNATFTLSCTGSGGTTAGSVVVTVRPATPPVLTSCQNGPYAGGFTPVLGESTLRPVASATPAKGAVFAEPNFGTCMVRVTDRAAEAGSPGFIRNDYSRRQAFNADSTLLVTYSLSGAWLLYDAATLRYLRVLPGPAGDAEPQWDPVNPNQLYYVPTNGGTVLNRLDVQNGTTTTVANFAGRLPWATAAHIWTKSEGGPSADARYWCFMVDDSSFNSLGIFVWDRTTDTIMGTLGTAGNRPDHLSMSPSGRHCVVSWLDETVSFSRQMVRERVVHTTSEHSDIAIGANGDDYYVAIDYQSAAGSVFMVNLDTGARTDLFPTYFNDGSTTAVHISGKAYARPGWVVVSSYAENGPFHWLHGKVFALELAANPRIVNLAHTQRVDSAGWSVQDGNYWTEPQASVNRDFTRVVFNSNWRAPAAAPENYMIVLPATGALP